MQTINIGRDASNQIILNDNLVSRHHAQLTVADNGRVTIKDLGSSNGTFVNGNRVNESLLNPGDIVKCGPVFLNWAQYVSRDVQTVQQMNYKQPLYNEPVSQGSGSDLLMRQYGLGDVFKYLTTRIFEIGDLFKTNWNKTSVILFLKIVPVLITLVISAIISSELPIGKFSIYPTLLAVLLFAISPFISVYLLSATKKISIDKVALASGIIGFVQFCVCLCFFCYTWFSESHVYSVPDFSGFGYREQHTILLPIAGALLTTFFIVNLSLAFFVFVYKYFISIGIQRGISIYLIIATTVINSFFQVLLAYLIVKDSFVNHLL